MWALCSQVKEFTGGDYKRKKLKSKTDENKKGRVCRWCSRNLPGLWLLQGSKTTNPSESVACDQKCLKIGSLSGLMFPKRVCTVAGDTWQQATKRGSWEPTAMKKLREPTVSVAIPQQAFITGRFYNFPMQCCQLGNKCSDMWYGECGGHFSFRSLHPLMLRPCEGTAPHLCSFQLLVVAYYMVQRSYPNQTLWLDHLYT